MQKKIAFLLIVLLISGCTRQHQTITDSSHYSKVETELGEAIHREILKAMPVYQGEELNHYVQLVGQNLAAVAERKDLAYRFVVLEDDRVYATSAPGGYVYVTTGLFRFLVSEIELAGILAHEIGLLQYKDPRFSKVKKAFELLLRTGSYVGPAFGTIGVLSVMGLALVGATTNGEKTLLQRTRDADKRALRYMVESGYDPQGLIDPLRRMLDPISPHRAYLYDYLQSHPLVGERFKRLDDEFSKLSIEGKQFDARRNQFLSATEVVRSTFVKK